MCVWGHVCATAIVLSRWAVNCTLIALTIQVPVSGLFRQAFKVLWVCNLTCIPIVVLCSNRYYTTLLE